LPCPELLVLHDMLAKLVILDIVVDH